MTFYICIDTEGCIVPEGIDGFLPEHEELTKYWFSRMIYVKNVGCSDFLSVAQKNDLAWGGYVSRYQVKKLKVKREV